MALIVFVGMEILNRFCYLFDELIKIKVEHGGSIIRVLNAAFSFNIPSAVIAVGSIFSFLVSIIPSAPISIYLILYKFLLLNYRIFSF